MDRSSRPQSCPHQTPARVEAGSWRCGDELQARPGADRGHRGVPASTVHRVLVRHGLNRLRWMDRPTGRVIRRIDTDRPGELVHVDVKKLGRIPDGGGWRAHGRGNDGHTRAAHADRLRATSTPPSTPTAASPTARSSRRERRDLRRVLDAAHAWFADHGITIEAVLTDNGTCYRSRAFARRARAGIEHTPHPALPTPDQRQSRTLQPHPARRMGLRPPLPLRRRPHRRP